MEKQKSESVLSRFIKGVVIALGFILPGVSGGVLAAILGIYERMLSFMAHLTKNFKENFLFFLPVGIGGVVGIGVLSKPLEWLLANYQIVVLWGFAGAIIGTLPSLLKESTSKRERRPIDMVWFVGTLVIGFLLLYFMDDLLGTLPANFFGFVIAGGLIALGVLVPGLSPSNLLLVLGLYDPMLKGFKSFAIIDVFVPIAIGGIVVMLAFSKLMEWLLANFHAQVYHFIIGIVAASTLLIVIPPVADYSGATLMTLVMSIILFILGAWLGLWMSKLEDKYK
ncbi:DUF368 domain-containing protein [Enterococcus sp. JM4C]|uniref:DUF368 domain-containing protein n=1 Tax=Candidatus Enterococcus huntleyi TaxID=1857217 RepID=UPI0013794EB3|nr:DUF368 domain-containing protein [Enterococcus sp. JM4C]KAF1298855.1 DUF368 domain-containing protein [Enterococcus sp. JM4C]